MDRHQAGQEETLVRMEMGSLEVSHPRRASRGCFKCGVALAAVMSVLVVLLLVGFILQYFLSRPSCIQESPSYSLKRTDVEGSYDIFTADKAARYLVYGWVTFSRVTNDEITLLTTFNISNTRTIQKTKISQTEIFFFHKATLVVGQKITIVFSSNFTDSSFHIHEL